jgi:hypothetical protein
LQSKTKKNIYKYRFLWQISTSENNAAWVWIDEDNNLPEILGYVHVCTKRFCDVGHRVWSVMMHHD